MVNNVADSPDGSFITQRHQKDRLGHIHPLILDQMVRYEAKCHVKKKKKG